MSFIQDIESKPTPLHLEANEKTSSASDLAVQDEHEANRKLRNKLDRRIVPSAALIYLLCYLDRSNIGNAKLLNSESGNSLMQSLSLTNLQYTIALMVFLIAYILFEVPSNYCLKHFKPSRWIAFLMFSWGALTISLGGVQSYGALTAVRFLLGAFEAGLFPGLVYFFTFWYRPEERSLRVALVLASSTLGGAFGGAIAYGIGHMNMKSGLEAWRWLFILEGIPSVLSSLLVWFFFPDFPETAKWLTSEERERAVKRLEGVASNHHSKVTWVEAKSTLLGWRLWAHAIAYITISVPFSSLSLFAPTIVAGLGYEGLNAQLFTVPPYACAYFTTLFLSWLADTKNQRSLVSAGSMAVGAFAFLAQALLPESAFKARFGLLCVAASGSFGSIPPLLGWLSTNIRGAGAVGLAIAINISMGGTGQIIGVWIYKANEKPGYITGHMTNFAMLLFGSLVVCGLRFYYTRQNRSMGPEDLKWAL
ncbi:putative transporter C11D3,18C [Schizosaccharomyces pombe 972h-] [Rhizoctonia solani]|uniref:Putative transporter C11D3,18C [Schizosaccharomyces pombe 972h-] n=1 Tax=Rhizoctonia solani TaxID=456999 RepID=A0A0K6FZH0_9AGAM|nr:putative transporter C11D3,18C [Schizosaccharomyces pombe 972h-] [Rhizoctonia solani]